MGIRTQARKQTEQPNGLFRHTRTMQSAVAGGSSRAGGAANGTAQWAVPPSEPLLEHGG